MRNEKKVFLEEMRKKTKGYQYFVLKVVFPENELKEYLNEIKNIMQKNTKCSKEGFGEDFDWENGNDWFGTNGENLYYFLDEGNNTKEDIKGEYNLKNKAA